MSEYRTESFAGGTTNRPGVGSRMLRWIPFLATLLEIFVFVLVGQAIGFGWAFFALFVSAAVGLFALRAVGLNTWRRLRKQAVSPTADIAAVQDALAGVGVRIFGALLVIVPGFVSTVVGLVLLVPPVGRLVSRLMPGAIVAGSLWRRGPAGSPTGANDGDVVPGEVVEVDVENVPEPDPSAPDYHDAITLPEGRDE